MRVIIDPGHGGDNIGATGHGMVEKEETLDISLKLYDKIKDDYETKILRTDDSFIANTQRAVIANGWGDKDNSLFVSVHFNAVNNPSAHGAEVLYFSSSAKGKKLANILQDKFLDYLLVRDRGIKTRNDLTVLRRTEMPAVLVEPLFLTNERDAQILKSDRGRKKIVKALEDGIRDYIYCITT